MWTAFAGRTMPRPPTPNPTGARVDGYWADIRPWDAHRGPKVAMSWRDFKVAMREGWFCTAPVDELELGSRVCASLCRQNCSPDNDLRAVLSIA